MHTNQFIFFAAMAVCENGLAQNKQCNDFRYRLDNEVECSRPENAGTSMSNPAKLAVTPVEVSEDLAGRIYKDNQSGLIGNLKDPDSAKFRKIRVAKLEYFGTQKTLICGEINSKNSYGGYGGFEVFLFDGNIMRIGQGKFPSRQQINGIVFNLEAVSQYCFEKGTTLVFL